MKKLVFIMTLTCLLCFTACQAAEPTVTTLSPTVPSNVAPVDDFDPALWNEYSDYELIEMTMERSAERIQTALFCLDDCRGMEELYAGELRTAPGPDASGNG